MKLKGVYTGFTLSVCPSGDRIISALYLQQYLNNIYTSYQATLGGVSSVKFILKYKNLKFCPFLKFVTDFVMFLLGIQYESIVG